MSALLSFAKTTIIGGLLFLLPVVLLVVIVEKALAIALRVLRPIAHQFPQISIYGVTVATIAAFVALLVLSFVAGLIARTAAGQRFVLWIEEAFLSKLPGYMMYKSMLGDATQSIAALEDQASTHAVLARIEDAWQIGFLVDEMDSGDLAIFIPSAPSPFSGSLYFLPKDRVRDSGISVHEATAVLRRIGFGSAERLRGKL